MEGKTFALLVKSPVVGASKEIVEQNNRAVDAMVDMMIAMSDFLAHSMGVAFSKSQEILEDYFEKLKNGEVESMYFNDFYKMWSSNVEGAMEKYFFSDELSELIARATDSAMVFKVEFDKVVEKALEESPIVTKNEVDNVYKNVYELKREVRELKKQIADLEGKLEAKNN